MEEFKSTYAGYEAQTYVKLAEAWDYGEFKGSYIHSTDTYVSNPDGDVTPMERLPANVRNILTLMIEQRLKDLQERLDEEYSAEMEVG